MNNRKIIGRDKGTFWTFWFRMDGVDNETGITFNGDVYGMVIERNKPPRYVDSEGVTLDNTLALTTAVKNVILKKG